jgi:hypothetical protein
MVSSYSSLSYHLDRSDIGNSTNYQLNSNNSYRSYNNVHGLTYVGGSSQTFDSDGNLATTQHAHTNAWDEAGMLKQVVVPGSPTMGIEGENNYGYDATQRRVFKNLARTRRGSEHIVYIHAEPNLIAEYTAGTAAASPNQEYVYAQVRRGGRSLHRRIHLPRSNGICRWDESVLGYFLGFAKDPTV